MIAETCSAEQVVFNISVVVGSLWQFMKRLLQSSVRLKKTKSSTMVLSNIEPGSVRESSSKADEIVCRENGKACQLDAERKVARAIGYMRGSLNQPLAVTQLARVASISPSHFFAVFKKRTGFAPMDYFIRLRMERACELLDATVMSVKQIAWELGYEDPFYFSRLFKSVNDVAPTEYREMTNGRKQLLRKQVWAGENGFVPTGPIIIRVKSKRK